MARLCMFHPREMPLERGWVGRIEGDEVVHLASQTLQHLFTGGGSARDHARYPLADVTLLVPLPSPPSVRVFDDTGSFEFANPSAIVGSGAEVAPPPAVGELVADVSLAGLVGLGEVVAVAPVARLRAPALPPPKDRDFAIVLGPWFTTLDEAPATPAVAVETAAGRRHDGAVPAYAWEDARCFAAENTRLRVGDLLLAPAALVPEIAPGDAVAVDVHGLGRLSFTASDRVGAA